MTLDKIIKEIKEAQNIVITAHINPDGDCLGSAIALMLILDRYNKKNFNDEIFKMKNIRFVLDDKLPKFMGHFPERVLVEYYPNFKMKEIDLLISVDSASIERIGNVSELREKATKMINIDHHISNTRYADINYVEDSPSTAEIIYKMIELFGVTLDKEIATFLYLGIINDTGNFTHSNVTAETFLTASKLMRQDINNNDITDILFGTSMGKARLLGKVYENKIINEELKFIYFYLPNEELMDLKIGKDETDGISEILLDIEGVEASLFVREESDGKVKGSLRSKHYYNVNETAGLFNGGGHIKAAGFNTTEKFTEIIEKIEKNLKEQLTKLSS